jgi:hypothetical protein
VGVGGQGERSEANEDEKSGGETDCEDAKHRWPFAQERVSLQNAASYGRRSTWESGPMLLRAGDPKSPAGNRSIYA